MRLRPITPKVSHEVSWLPTRCTSRCHSLPKRFGIIIVQAANVKAQLMRRHAPVRQMPNIRQTRVENRRTLANDRFQVREDHVWFSFVDTESFFHNAANSGWSVEENQQAALLVPKMREKPRRPENLSLMATLECAKAICIMMRKISVCLAKNLPRGLESDYWCSSSRERRNSIRWERCSSFRWFRRLR